MSPKLSGLTAAVKAAVAVRTGSRRTPSELRRIASGPDQTGIVPTPRTRPGRVLQRKRKGQGKAHLLATAVGSFSSISVYLHPTGESQCTNNNFILQTSNEVPEHDLLPIRTIFRQ
jgi:hypothetical protein